MREKICFNAFKDLVVKERKKKWVALFEQVHLSNTRCFPGD